MTAIAIITAFLWSGIGLADQASNASPREWLPGRYWMVGIGVEGYSQPPWLGVPKARSQLRQLHQIWTDSQSGLVDPQRAWLLLDEPDPNSPWESRATRAAVTARLQEIARQAGPNDVLLLAMAVGVARDGVKYRWLLPGNEDSTLDSLGPDDWRNLFQSTELAWTITFALPRLQPIELGPDQRPADPAPLWSTVFQGMTGPGRFAFVGTPNNPQNAATLELPTLEWCSTAKNSPSERVWLTAADAWERTASSSRSGSEPRSTVLVGRVVPPNVPLMASHEAVERIRKNIGRLDSQNAALPAGLAEDVRRAWIATAPSPGQRDLGLVADDWLAGKATEQSVLAAKEAWERGQKLSPAVPMRFTNVVLEGRKWIDQEYILPARGASCLSAGVRALYREAIRPVPDSLREALRSPENVTAQAWSGLLAQARLDVGNPADWTEQQAEEITLAAMMESLDPYSRYIPNALYQEVRRETRGNFAGVGLLVHEDPASRILEVVTPVFNSPAFRAGLRSGDRILKIDGRDVRHLDPEAASLLLSGKPGQAVRLTYVPYRGFDPIEVPLIRETIHVETVLGIRRRPDATWDHWLDPKQRFAYVRLASFTEETTDDLRRLLRTLDREGVRGMILDLRFNPGGVLDSAIDSADLFLGRKQEIVTLRYRRGPSRTVLGSRTGSFADIPLVVLINGSSASGSELLAAALVGNKRAILVGEQTFGKGSIQNFHPSSFDAGAMKLTVGLFLAPGGTALDRWVHLSNEQPSWGVLPSEGWETRLSAIERRELEYRLRQAENITADPHEAPGADDRQLARAREALIELRNQRSKR